MREEQRVIFDDLRPRLIRACRVYLGGLQAEAEDIVQDACMMVGPQLDSAEAAETSAAWLQQVCLQLCGERRRNQEGIVRCLEAELSRPRQGQAFERVHSDNLEVQKQQWIGLLREAIKPLSLQARQMLQLRNVKGLSYAQIGATLELSWPEVAARLAQARQELHSSLEPELVEAAASSLIRGPWAPEAGSL